MEPMQLTEANWFDDFDFNSQLEIMQELQEDNLPQFIISPDQQVAESKSLDEPYESIINKLISAVYSGPTISDIESALSLTNVGCNISNPLFGLADHKGLGKMDHKYTFKIKTSGTGLADDGYKWRKYGQKSIKNSPNPRSYYRCTNPRCNAKKQVERSMEEPDMLIITYEGLHLHYTYSHLLPAAPPDHCSNASLYPAAKKLKFQSTEDGGAAASPPLLPMSSPSVGDDDDDGIFDDVILPSSQGLLEDVVPLPVRRPCISTDSSSSSSPTSCFSLSWIATSSCVDHGVLSSIM